MNSHYEYRYKANLHYDIGAVLDCMFKRVLISMIIVSLNPVAAATERTVSRSQSLFSCTWRRDLSSSRCVDVPSDDRGACIAAFTLILSVQGTH